MAIEISLQTLVGLIVIGMLFGVWGLYGRGSRT
jgi:hypothetical protein